MKPYDLVAVCLDTTGDKIKEVERIAGDVLRKVLEEEEVENGSIAANNNLSALSTSQLLSSSLSPQTTGPLVAASMALNPLQLALCQSIVAGNALPFPVFGGPSPPLPMFVPPPQPTVVVDSAELTRLLQSLLAKQKK